MVVPWRIHAKGITSVGILWTMYQLAWRDDEKITWEDFPELASGSLALGILWAPEILTIAAASTTPLVILEAAIVVGAVASIAIAGDEGLETYVDYINPRNWKENVQDPEKVESLIQASDIVLSVVNPLHIPSKMLSEWIVEDLPWGEVFRSRWVTGPVLPLPW